MAKLPPAPGAEALRAHPPALSTLPAGSSLARIYFTDGIAAASWRHFRTFGPLGSRFDHHQPDVKALPQEQQRAIFYCAIHVDTCLAECFQLTRQINRIVNAPWLAVFQITRDIKLLDLTGPFTTRIGASTAINSGSRKRARAWSRDSYVAYPEIQGILYSSSMNGHAPAVALYERAQPAIPHAPLFNRPLTDDTLLDVLKHTAARLGYGVN